MRTGRLITPAIFFHFVLPVLVLFYASSACAFSVFTGRGDLDGDGRLTLADVDLLRQCPGPAYCTADKGDFNGDLLLNNSDVTILNLMVLYPKAYLPQRQIDSATTYNYSDSSNFHCRQLAVTAYKSLGRLASGISIKRNDFIFCGKYYIAWIDNTGFTGELNGLWLLNGQLGNSLTFVDPNPRNLMIVSEHRDGRLPPGYSGALHLEVLPEHTSEGYGIDEGGQFRKREIPWWRGCNKRSTRFTDIRQPISISAPPGLSDVALKLVYESRLTKEADFSNYRCPDAHADYLFPDGVRRPLFLQTGWELYGDRNWLIRTIRGRNPSGNPIPGVRYGFPYVVHSLTITSLLNPPLDKGFRDWILPLATVEDPCRQSTFPANIFTYNGGPYQCTFDNAVNYLTRPAGVAAPSPGTPMLVSRSPGISYGDSIMLFDPVDIDVGFCDCIAGGGLELPAGALRDLSTLPGGQMTAEHQLVFIFPQ